MTTSYHITACQFFAAPHNYWLTIFPRHGAQGQFDGASNLTLDNEFGTHDEEAAIKQILENGILQESEVRTVYLSSLVFYSLRPSRRHLQHAD